jgi:hypothetical protein
MNNYNNENDPYTGNSKNFSSSENNGNTGNNVNQSNYPKKKRINIKPQFSQKQKSLSSIEDEIKKLENGPKNTNNKPQNSNNKPQNNIKININPVPPPPPPVSKSRPIIIPDEDNLCSDPSVPCKLTKMEMCVKIVLNLMTRNNIILAILSTIPIPNKNGDYEGSFTFDRLTSLKKGRFCAPSFLTHFQDEEDDVSEEEEVQSRVVPVKEDTIVVQKKAVSCILCMYTYECIYEYVYINMNI